MQQQYARSFFVPFFSLGGVFISSASSSVARHGGRDASVSGVDVGLWCAATEAGAEAVESPIEAAAMAVSPSCSFASLSDDNLPNPYRPLLDARRLRPKDLCPTLRNEAGCIAIMCSQPLREHAMSLYVRKRPKALR